MTEAPEEKAPLNEQKEIGHWILEKWNQEAKKGIAVIGRVQGVEVYLHMMLQDTEKKIGKIQLLLIVWVSLDLAVTLMKKIWSLSLANMDQLRTFISYMTESMENQKDLALFTSKIQMMLLRLVKQHRVWKWMEDQSELTFPWQQGLILQPQVDTLVEQVKEIFAAMTEEATQEDMVVVATVEVEEMATAEEGGHHTASPTMMINIMMTTKKAVTVAEDEDTPLLHIPHVITSGFGILTLLWHEFLGDEIFTVLMGRK